MKGFALPLVASVFAFACSTSTPAGSTDSSAEDGSASSEGEPTSGSGGRSSAAAGADAGSDGGRTDGGGAGGLVGVSGSAGESSAGGEGGAQPVSASVRAVSATGSSESYEFNVTVESDDIDCSQFANWWEVLDEKGNLIYRRILAHSHTDENGTTDADAPGNSFTRSGGPVEVLEDQVVIVRAHMSTGGYHGDVMRGSVLLGFAVARDLGPNFALDVESEEPQPDGCEF